MLGKFGILVAILALVLLFYIVISLGAGAFKKDGVKQTKRYLKSVNILLIVVAVVGSILVLFL